MGKRGLVALDAVGEKLFLVIIWAVLLYTIAGPMAVGWIVKCEVIKLCIVRVMQIKMRKPLPAKAAKIPIVLSFM